MTQTGSDMNKRTMDLSKSSDTFSCPVCSETLKSPKILPCLHSFCEQCIHEFILSTARKKDIAIKDFNCPVCRTVVKPKDAEAKLDQWAKSLQDNVIINTVLTMDHGNKALECQTCKRYNQTFEAKSWCKQCYEAFCEKCISMHNRMTLLMTHDVVPIEDVGRKTGGLDLRAVSEYCGMHPLKMVDVFCFQHKTACCGLCAGINHRKCDNESTTTLLQAKQQEKANIKVMAENTEEDAANFIQGIRSKLDICFETFKKQLTVFHDEQNTRLNIRIRLLEQLIQSIEHWAKVTEVVQTSGSITQFFFLHVETVKKQIENSTTELEQICGSDIDIYLSFKKNETLQKVESVDQIGSLSIEEREKDTNQMGDVFKICSNFEICIQRFEGIRIEHLRTMHFPGSKLTCGVCITDKFILLGDASTNPNILHLVDITTGLTINKTKITGSVKRLYFDKDLSRIFISCYTKKLFSADLKGETIAHINRVSLNTDFVGALCRFDKHIYIIVDDSVKKFFPSDPPMEMTRGFPTNTNSRGLNGMTISKEKIFYTTIEKEIKCSSLNGRNIFTYKSDKIRNPVSIVMLSLNVLIILDKKGALYALSNDGKKQATLLEKFEKVVDPWDMWISTDDNTVYIAGGEYIDVFKIKFD
ncbi:unnamed protein product [Mytilus edulis]|uniref:TRIM56 n=1 Tax=Mytilus edulis TaxID=6550 RepID=A0A8S3T6P2_MYTED|nr:unnamed protein product [Mytilus edulis]